MSSSLAKMMMPRAFGVSMSLLITLLNSPGFGSLGILMDWAIQTPPGCRRCQSQSFTHQGHRHTIVTGTESSKGNGACPQGTPSTLPTINPEPHLTACALTDGHSIGSFRPQTTHPPPLPWAQAHQPLERSAQKPQPHSRHSCPQRPAWTRSSIPVPALCPPWPGPGRSRGAPRGRRSHSVWSR